MSSGQAKQIRKAVKEAKMDVVQMFDSLKSWPFRMRLKLAWLLTKGR